MIDPTQRIEGPYGTAEHVPMPDPSEDYAPKARAALAAHRGTWLVTSPIWTPAWSQYVVSVIDLADHDGLPTSKRKFDGATHELLVLALNPEHGPHTVEAVQRHCLTGSLPFLTPINVAEQFEATDDEMGAVAWLAARAIVHGALPAEPPLGYQSFREHWLAVCTKALAHLRGEAHAS